MTHNSSEPHILIIGAGTGGLALAHALKNANIRATVFERDQTPSNDQGYRVGISPAGSRALKSCVSLAIFDLFVAVCARPPRYFNFLTEKLSEVLCLELSGEAADHTDGEKNIVRATLRQVLMTGLEDSIVFGKDFTTYTPHADGSITAHFSDGTTATGTLLVGADGSSSRVRKQRLPQARLEDTGLISIGGKLPMTADSKALLSDKMFNGMSIIMAPRGFGAIIHSLEFSQTRANTDFLQRWPQFKNAISEDSIGWGIYGAQKNFPSGFASTSPQELKNIALAATQGWSSRFQELINATDLSTIQRIDIRTSVPPAIWEPSNVTLLGDAIHTMTPGRGAGANTALRDAALLRDRLVDVTSHGKPLLEAIGEYEVEMLRYSSEAVHESRMQMNSRDWIHTPLIGDLQLAAMRIAMRCINAMPFAKRLIIQNIMRVRGAN